MESYLSLPGDYTILSQTITDLNSIQSYQIVEDFNYDNYDSTVLQRNFRWSFDQDVWSEWVDLTIQKLEAIPIEDDQLILYFQIRIVLISGEPVTVNSIDKLIITKGITTTPTPRPITAYSVGNSKGTAFLDNFYFDPYAVSLGVELQRKLSYTINQIFGHKVAYIRVTPQMRSMDVILKEYGLYESSKDFKCIKLLVPNNQFPDAKFQYNPFNIDYDEPFEVHIDKRYFESFFGKGVGPQKRDIIYFALANRMYEVASSSMHRDFMYKDLYYKVLLTKYADKANVIKDDDIQAQIDQLTRSTEEAFGDGVAQELEKIANPQQFTVSTRKTDKIRDYMDQYLQIEERDLQNYHTLISHYRYDLSGSPSDENGLVRTMLDYIIPVEWDTNAERTLTCWFLLRNPNTILRSITVLEQYDDELVITMNADPKVAVGDTVTITKPNTTLSIFGTVIEEISGTKIRISLDTQSRLYSETEWPGWYYFSGLQIRKNYPRLFIDGRNNSTGFSLENHEGKYFIAKIGSQSYTYILPTVLSTDTWYCLAFTYSSLYKQATLRILRRKWDPNTNTPLTTDMNVLYEYTYDDINIEDASNPYKYKIPASFMKMTNLRLMSVTIEPEKIVKFLNESIVADSDQAIIIDNAVPRIKLPYIGGHPNKLI